MSKDIETMINEAPVLTLDPFSTSELPAESSQAATQATVKKIMIPE